MKEKFFSKIVKKDYNDRLEEILSDKNFSEDVKNSLLSVFYNLESGYDDYVKVKRNVLDKNEYIENLMNIIKNECDSIIFLNKNNGDTKEVVDKNKKEIRCFPIPNNILYSLSKIRNKNIEIKYLDKNIEEAFTFLLDMGDDINFVEPLRDFNGFSWNLIINGFENIKCNLIFQNLIFIVGSNFLSEWVNGSNDNNDFFNIFRKKMELKYGKKVIERLIINIAHFSILLKAFLDENFKKRILEQIIEVNYELSDMENKEIYISKISEIKKEKQKEIRNLDKLINDNNLLKLEYEKQNEKLSKQNKIFSIRVLKNILIEERKEILSEIENLNKKMDPKYYFRLREYTRNVLSIIEIYPEESIDKQIETIAIKLQKDIIQCLLKDIKKIDSKEELINYIYMFRYYNLLPFSKEENICDIEELRDSLDELALLIFNKAIEMKLIVKICEENVESINLIKKILITRIISLEDIYIKVSCHDKSKILTIFDEDIEDSKIILNQNEKTMIKLNKKIKLFT